ncbi:hypothetical protein PQX77_021145 [Marasmius sp. AFHP31]|nr:hypothetical protein PQX77_021145 [Marasmius sp. AFHP31]
MAPKKFTINKSTIDPRIRHAESKPKPPTLTKEQRDALNEQRRENNESIKKDVEEWLVEVTKKADSLAAKYKRTRRYFLDMFFQGGVRLVRPRAQTNSYNAFKYVKAKRAREEGGPKLDVEDLDDLYREEYEGLTVDELQPYIDEYEEDCGGAEDDDDGPHLPRNTVRLPNARSRAQDMSNALTNVTKILNAMSLRCGSEAILLVVRNRTDPFMEPFWYYSNPKLEHYMPFAIRGGWDSEKVGARCEAFAVAGCDTANLAKNSKDKATLLKAEIRDLLKHKLAHALGVETVQQMEYKQFDRVITYKTGVVIEGWPLPKFANPSDLGSAVGPLGELKEALLSGKCGFRKMQGEEFRNWIANYDKDVKEGKIVPEVRKPRSDAGVPRGPRKKAVDQDDDDSSEDENGEDEEEWAGISNDEPTGSNVEVRNAVGRLDGKVEAVAKSQKGKRAATQGIKAKDVKVKEAKAKAAKVKATKKGKGRAESEAVKVVEEAIASETAIAKKPSRNHGGKKASATRDDIDTPGLVVAVRSPPPVNRPKPQKRAKQPTPDNSPVPEPAPHQDISDPRESQHSNIAPDPDLDTHSSDPASAHVTLDVDKDETSVLRDVAKTLKRKIDGLDGKDMLSGKRPRKPTSRRDGAEFGE